jgi:hypothetical protein
MLSQFGMQLLKPHLRMLSAGGLACGDTPCAGEDRSDGLAILFPI